MYTSQTMPKLTLLNAFATGQPIYFYDHGMNLELGGIIQGISLESGFTSPNQPRNFNVMLRIDRCEYVGFLGTTREIYIRTND